MTAPKVSIITVCYNAIDTIEETILSVIRQTYSNIEYIIIDGASTDGTIEVINKYLDEIALFVSEADDGLYEALNKGVVLATGDWIGILNCGDLFHDSNVISNVARIVSTIDENVGVVYGDSIEIDGDSRTPVISIHELTNKNVPPQYRHGASFVRSNIHKEHLFDISKKYKYDYALDYLQIYNMNKSGVKFYYISFVVLDYLKCGKSSHPLKNIYLRNLIEFDGKKSVSFFVCLWNELFTMFLNIIKKIRII